MSFGLRPKMTAFELQSINPAGAGEAKIKERYCPEWTTMVKLIISCHSS